jgi:hypothetical protein
MERPFCRTTSGNLLQHVATGMYVLFNPTGLRYVCFLFLLVVHTVRMCVQSPIFGSGFYDKNWKVYKCSFVFSIYPWWYPWELRLICRPQIKALKYMYISKYITYIYGLGCADRVYSVRSVSKYEANIRFIFAGVKPNMN